MTDQVIKKINGDYDKLFRDNIEKTGHTIEDIKNGDAICVEQGNTRHYFLNKRYMFSMFQRLEYQQSENKFKCDMVLESYYDEKMENYQCGEEEEG